MSLLIRFHFINVLTFGIINVLTFGIINELTSGIIAFGIIAFAIFGTLIYIFSNPPALPRGYMLGLSQANITFTFIIIGFISVSYTGSVINLTDIINLPSILAHISDNFFLSNSIQEIPNMPSQCVSILDINNLKPKYHNDFFFAKDLATVIGQRPFLYICDYTYILKYKYLILPFAATMSYNFICKFDLMELCKQVRVFLALILRLFETSIFPISPTYTNYQVYSYFNTNYTYPAAILNQEANALYNNISSIFNDTRVRINQIQDYLRDNNLTLIYDDNYDISIETIEDMDPFTFHRHVAYLREQNEIIEFQNTHRDELINDLRNVELDMSSENSDDVFHRSDFLKFQFDSIIEEYNS